MSLQEKTVIVADDDPHNRAILTATLRALGCEVLEATSGDEAFSIVLAREVHLVISDIRMANGTGVELLRRMRRLEKEKGHAPPVMISTALLDGGENYLRALGAKEVFMKPLDLDLVEAAVRRVLS